MRRMITKFVLAACCTLFCLNEAEGKINIELRPATSAVDVNTNVNIGLYFVSDSKDPQLTIAADIVFGWDNTKLQFLGIDNTGGASVMSSYLPERQPLNEALIPQDGNGFYQMLGNLGEPLPVSPSGTLMTTFKFKSLSTSGVATFSILPSAGDPARYTRVLDGTVPNLTVTGTIGSPAQVTVGNVVVGSLRIIETVPNGGKAVTQDNTTIQSVEFRGYTGSGVDGRDLMIFAKRATLFDVLFVPGNDDALGFVGDTRGSIVANCIFPVVYGPMQNNVSKALIGYTNAAASNVVGPTLGSAEGYAATFYNCDFQGGSVRLVGGVWQFVGCKFVIGALGGIQAMDAKINLINCSFVTVPKPPEFGYWYQNNDPCGIRVAGLLNGTQTSTTKTKLYIVNCTLNGNPVDGPALSRRWPTSTDAAAGRTAYGLPGSVSSTVFRSTPIYN